MKRLTLQSIWNDGIPANYKINIQAFISLIFELTSLTNEEFNKNKLSKLLNK